MSSRRKAVRIAIRGGSAEDPLVVEDSDDETITVPLRSSSQTQFQHASPFLLQRTPSPQKRKPPVEPQGAPFFELQPKSWVVVDSPRKKPKLAVEVVIPSRSKSALGSKASKHIGADCLTVPVPREEIGQDWASSEGYAVPTTSADTRPLSPLSPLSPSPPGSPVRNNIAGSSRRVQDRPSSEPRLSAHATAREQSRELSYLDEPLEPPSLVNSIILPGSDGAAAAAGPSTTRTPGVALVRNPPSTSPQAGPSTRPKHVPVLVTRMSPRIQDRLVNVPRFAIPSLSATLKDLLVARADMSISPWGLSTRRMCVTQKRADKRSFIFPQFKHNPHLPLEPGHPGLLYRANDAFGWDTKAAHHTIFTGLGSSRYRYVGEYRLTKDDPMSPEEFVSSKPEITNIWVNSIAGKPKFEDIRTRVILRDELAREPTVQEVASARQARRFRELNTDAQARAKPLIRIAYKHGDERLGIWRMECVGFDLNMLQQIADKMDEKAQHGTAPDMPAYNTGAASG
ncbi:hypothetical protein C8Q70DRAFT_539990 [Cubamyces menziesii]|nr:hypothetical protein C8Q70DRAFT_539990 [Cubamyces menziesii]